MKFKLNQGRFSMRKRLLMNIMRTFIFLCCTIGFALSPNDIVSQNTKIIVEEDTSLSMDEVFKLIMNQTDYKFFYEKGTFKDLPEVNVKEGVVNVNKLLVRSLSNGNFDIEVTEKNVILIKEIAVSESIKKKVQEHQISGVVVDKDGNPLPGASIMEKGTINGTETDFDGNFSLTVSNENAILVISFIGFTPIELAVDGQSTINVTLQEDAAKLDEVVIVGYGTKKKANLTGAVSSVKFEDMESRPAPNTAALLQGQAAGVTVQAGSPKPGGETVDITIRGKGSFNNNSPLILIDGIEGDLASVPPSDIESVSVLKDAASASIYGVRAANGVILVTTKRGRTGAPTVSVQFNYALQERGLKLDMLDGPQWAETWNLIAEEEGKGSDYYFYPDEIAKIKDGSDPDHWANTNWDDEVYRTAPMKKTYASISGGTEKVKYLVSAQYLDQEGIIHESSNEQLNTRANVSADITDKFRAGLNMNFISKHVNNAPVNEYGIHHYKPTIPVKYSNGGYGFADGSYSRFQRGGGNPVYNFDRNHNFSDAYTFSNRIFAEYDIIKDLTFTTTVANTIFTSRHEQFGATWAQYTPEGELMASNDRNSAMNASVLNKNFQWENILTYKFKLKEKHDFNFLAGYSIKTYRHDRHMGTVKDFPNDKLYVLSVGVNDKDVSGEAWESSLQSYFGRMNYNFDGKYLFEANIRRDGSSRFPESNRFGIFPAFSGAWIVSNESFAQNMGPISTLKLRGSWGQLGNQEIGDYQFQTAIVTGADYTVGNTLQPGAAVGALTNPDIGWETTTMTNIGIDVNFFNNKLALTADVFDKTTTDILMRLPVPYTSGFGVGPLQNVAAVQNKGFELGLEYRNNAGEFKYAISGNVSKINNEITDFGGLNPSIWGFGINEKGYAMNTYYGLVADGLFPTEADAQGQKQHGVFARAGDIRYKDISGPDGVPDGQIDNAYDRTHLGNPFPDLTYAFNVSFDWKGFDFSMFWQGVSGISNQNYVNMDVLELNTNFTERVLDAWTPNNTSGSWPRWGNLANNRWNGSSSYWIEDGSYLRLKNLELGYTLPKKMITDIGLSSVRVYFSGANLLTISNVEDYDPEKPWNDDRALTTYPLTKLYSLGFNLTF